MAPLLQELSTLEIESLEVIVDPTESKQHSGLDTISTAQGEIDVAGLLIGTLPTNDKCCCCFCCCTVCCCAG